MVQKPDDLAGMHSLKPLRLDVVIPVLNEAHVLERSVTTVREFLAEAGAPRNWAWRVVVVDNGSTDGTDRVAMELVAAHPAEVQFIQLPERGRGRALRQAWTQSDADIVSYMDVDLSTELAALPKLVDAISDQGYDLGTGSRLLPDSKTTRSAKREVISRLYNVLIKAVLWTSFSDAQCGFKVLSRRVVKDIIPDVKDQSWFFDTELLVLAEKRGYRLKDLPVTWIEDDDSRVKIVKTAWDDIKGVARIRWKLWREMISPVERPSPASRRA
jgi:glycosyltransferase involved in cell wall biosynthesis